MEVSAPASRAEPTPRQEQDGNTYSAATRSRSTSTQPIATPSTATHTSWFRIARAMRSAAARAAHFSACSLDIAGTASARMARRRIFASAASSAAAARGICIRSHPCGLTTSRCEMGNAAHATKRRPSGSSYPSGYSSSWHTSRARAALRCHDGPARPKTRRLLARMPKPIHRSMPARPR
jgi:hypothetical protein